PAGGYRGASPPCGTGDRDAGRGGHSTPRDPPTVPARSDPRVPPSCCPSRSPYLITFAARSILDRRAVVFRCPRGAVAPGGWPQRSEGAKLDSARGCRPTAEPSSHAAGSTNSMVRPHGLPPNPASSASATTASAPSLDLQASPRCPSGKPTPHWLDD